MSALDLTRIIAWLSLVAVLAGAVAPGQWRLKDVLVSAVDHTSSFAVVGAIFILAYPHDRRIAVGVLIVSAVTSEILHLVSGRRDPSVSDALAKILAAAVGVAIGCLMLHLIPGQSAL